MQANWSLILNVVLLIGVVVAIGRLMKARRQQVMPVSYQPTLGKVDNFPADDIIAVRKLSQDASSLDDYDDPIYDAPVVTLTPAQKPSVQVTTEGETTTNMVVETNKVGQSVMMFLLAKENRQLAGYELLQTVLAAGLRFGEGHLFHRHQQSNGQGPVIFSLASATDTGVFDLQNIGGFSVRGLCLFMRSSGNATIDAERFDIMLETARQLSEDLDTLLLDEKQKKLTKESISRYYQVLNIRKPVEFVEMA